MRSTWTLLSRQHEEVLTKIHIHEEAILYLLGKKVAHEESERLTEDFLKLFKKEIITHFKIEETALFPILKWDVKDAERLISQLLSEHKNIINKYFKLQNAKDAKLNKTEDLTILLKELSEHARKEEKFLPPLIASLNNEQLKRIDEQTRRLGHSKRAHQPYSSAPQPLNQTNCSHPKSKQASHPPKS